MTAKAVATWVLIAIVCGPVITVCLMLGKDAWRSWLAERDARQFAEVQYRRELRRQRWEDGGEAVDPWRRRA